MRLGARLSDALLRQRGALFAWTPVFLGLGIGIYFLLPVEPTPLVWAAVALGGVAALTLTQVLGPALAPLAMVVALVAAGLTLAGIRAWSVAEPVLGFRYYGPVEGRVILVDRSASEAPRVLLDQVVLENVSPGRTPARVRLSLLGPMDWITPEPGLRLMVTAFLSPPSGPAEPGDFDFRRYAWFDQLGATGYARKPALVLEPAELGQAGLMLARLRLGLSGWLKGEIAGDAGGFAAAVTTGDRSGLSVQASRDLRAANVYHLVSISGMHMAMLTAFVFALIRGAVALVPPLALRVSSKKIAALVALPVAAGYLALAGRGVPTERAFVMVAVALLAIVFDRRAISMRGVALAALVVLVLRPESLINAGFQMSFSAVVALIAVFAMLGPMPRRGLVWRVVTPVALLLLSSLVAGLATAPFAAAHFNRIAWYGLIANLMAVPAMGLMVMPGAVILALLGPVGLPGPGLWLMEAGSRWILAVSHQIAALPGAMSAVITPPPATLPLIAFGLLFVTLWQGRERWIGLVPCLVAVWLWQGAARPTLLISQGGGLIGYLGPQGRAMSREKTDSYEAGIWLENDGVLRSQAEATDLPGLEIDGAETRLALGGVQILQVRGKRALQSLPGCGGAELLITNVRLRDTTRDAASLPCETWDVTRLAASGALAIDPGEGGLIIRQALPEAGDRLWTRPTQ